MSDGTAFLSSHTWQGIDHLPFAKGLPITTGDWRRDSSRSILERACEPLAWMSACVWVYVGE